MSGACTTFVTFGGEARLLEEVYGAKETLRCNMYTSLQTHIDGGSAEATPIHRNDVGANAGCKLQQQLRQIIVHVFANPMSHGYLNAAGWITASYGAYSGRCG